MFTQRRVCSNMAEKEALVIACTTLVFSAHLGTHAQNIKKQECAVMGVRLFDKDSLWHICHDKTCCWQQILFDQNVVS